MAYFAAAAAVLIVLALVLRRMKRHQRRADLLMSRMRTSAMYSRLYPVLERCGQCCVERVLIRPEEVRILLYKPMNRSFRFIFEDYGFDPVDQPVALKALAQAVALDVPDLGDTAKYCFSTHTAPRDGGGSFCWYEYTVQPDHKDRMLRAWYDHGDEWENVI